MQPTKQPRRNNFLVFGAVVVIVVAAIAVGLSLSAGSSTTTATASTSPTTTATRSPLISFSADAYSIETTALLNAFSQSTGIAVAPVKSAGSFADANQIAAGAPDDVFVTVALSAASSQYLKNLTANWAVGFASDQMVIAYSNSSATSAVVTDGQAAAKSNATSGWNAFFTALTSGDVKVGISSPLSDPAGLRGWLVLEAAGSVYASGNQSAYVAPLLRSGGNVTGTNAAALVAPLESGQIQFLFIYKSAAISDHLPYIQLDRHVNLGDPTLGAYYSKFGYTDSAGVTSGSPIVLAITVPLSSTNSGEALQFVQYVVKNAGTLAAYGLQPLSPALLYSNVTPPASIEQLVTQGSIIEAGALP